MKMILRCCMVLCILLASCVPAPTAPAVEPNAGSWQTWVVTDLAAVRPPTPPDQAATQAEIAELKTLTAQRDDAAQALVAYWDAGSPSYRWIEIALAQFKSKPFPNPRIARGMSLMNVAIYDATVAAWQAKHLYNRPRPSRVDPTLTTLAATPNSPAYPAEHAVVAGAAAAILGYLYPDDAQTFAAKAEEAGQSRLLAGVNYPSDVAAGLELGRQVAEQVIARAQADGSNAEWDGQRPTGAGYWAGENPLVPLAGSWQPWVLTAGDELRPPAPYAYDSAELAAEIGEIKAITHTWQLDGKALYWHTADAVFGSWYDNASRRIFEHHLDRNPPQAARIYALMSVAHYDAYIACWDAKYTYWSMRPYQVDPTVATLLPPPPHPSYPSGHGCTMGAIATILAHLFPEQAASVNGLAAEAGESRIWAGIHYRQDIEVGLTLGQAVAQKVIERDQ